MRAILIHLLVLLSFAVVIWVNLLDKSRSLLVAFTTTECVAGILIYVALLWRIKRASRAGYAAGYLEGYDRGSEETAANLRQCWRDLHAKRGATNGAKPHQHANRQ